MAKSKTPAKGKATAANARQAKIDAARKATSTGPNKILIGTVVAVIAIIAVVGGVIVNSQSQKSKVTQGGKAVPAGAAGMGAGWVANTSVKLVPDAPTVAVYEDFRCPVCKAFEQAFGGAIQTAAEAGKIKLVYHFKTVIDSNAGGDNSQVAASNALCAADQGVYFKYHNSLYANQPATEGDSFTKAQFTQFATEAGLSGTKLSTFQTCVDAGKYMNYVQSTEDASFKAGITGTPALFVNHVPVNFQAFATSAGQPDVSAFTAMLESGKVSDAQKNPQLAKAKDNS